MLAAIKASLPWPEARNQASPNGARLTYCSRFSYRQLVEMERLRTDNLRRSC